MFPVSTRGRYAVRILTCLASGGRGETVTKRRIAESEAISPDYIEQILLSLKAAGLVRSHRGRLGGFSLARAPEQITLARILEATDGPVAPAPCLQEGQTCDRAGACPTRPVWQKAGESVQAVLDETTLADLAEPAEEPTH